jgi:two-component sensor histidine kinase
MEEILFFGVLATSIVIQLAAAVCAICNTSLSPARIPWILISTAIVLMTVRRVTTFVTLVTLRDQPLTIHWNAELIALTISILMLSGMVGLGMALRGVYRKVHETEEIFRESLHTSKNNLQSLAGLLRSRANFTASPEVREFVQEIEQKVAVYGLLQKQLFERDAAVDYRSYISSLVDTVESAYSLSSRFFPVRQKVEAMEVSARETLYAGLIVSEALINVFKHARSSEKITVDVSSGLGEGGKRYIEIRDNGTGFPPEIVHGETGGFGTTFLREMNGDGWEVSLHNGGGAVVSVRF